MSIREIPKSVLVVVGVGALAIAGLFAGRVSGNAFRRGSHGDFGPRMFGRIARALDLTDDQKTRIKGVLRSHASEIETQLTAGTAARQAVHDAVVAQPVDESAIRLRAADVGRVQGDGAVLFAKIWAEVRPILTGDQQQKIQTFQQRMRRRGEDAARAWDTFLRSDS